METGDLIGLGLTVTSFLAASSTFLLGFYLSEKIRGTPSDRLGLYKFSIIGLSIPSFLVTLPLLWMILDAKDSNWILLSSFLLVSLVPPIVTICVLVKSWD